MSRNLLIAGVVIALIGAAVWWLALSPDRYRPAEVEASLASGIELFNEGKYAAAMEVLDDIPAGSPQDAKARYYQGSALMMTKDYEAAARKLEEALALEEQDIGTLYALGVVYFKLGNLKLARAYFAAVLEINPDDEQAKGLMDVMADLERRSSPAPDDAADADE